MRSRLGIVVCACVACGDGGSTTDAGPDASTDGTMQDNNAPETVTETPPPTPRNVGGTVHFLQGAGPLVLQVNGGSDLDVTQNGTFTFAGKVNQGTPFTVTVKTQPPNQVCSARGGTGSGIVMNGDVTNVLVACTVAIENTATTIGALQPVTFTNDIAAKGLLIGTVPEISVAQFGNYGEAMTTLALDGTTVTTSYYGSQPSSKSTTETIYAVVDLPVGSHSATFGLAGGAEGTTFPMRVDAIVLDSLSTFAQVASTTGGAATATSSTLTALQADVTFSTSSTSPVLSLFEGLFTHGVAEGGAPGPSDPLVHFQLSLDGTALATGHIRYDDIDVTTMLVGIGTAPSGTHALQTAWALDFGSPTISGSRADAIVLSPSAHFGTSAITSDESTSSTTFVTIPNFTPIALSPKSATQALVVLQLDGAPNPSADGNGANQNSSPDGAGGQFAIAVDNVVVGTSVVTAAYKSSQRAATIVQLVPLTAGAHTIQPQYKATLSDVHTGPGTSTFSALLIE